MNTQDQVPKNILFKKDDLINSTEDYIVHQTNCVTNDVKGVASSIFEKYPWSNTYQNRPRGRDKPGTIAICTPPCDNQAPIIINAYAQNYPGKPKSYETEDQRRKWFEHCLNLISDHIKKQSASIAFPYRIGCGFGGGKWDDYFKMLTSFAMRNPHFTIVIYKLGDA